MADRPDEGVSLVLTFSNPSRRCPSGALRFQRSDTSRESSSFMTAEDPNSRRRSGGPTVCCERSLLNEISQTRKGPSLCAAEQRVSSHVSPEHLDAGGVLTSFGSRLDATELN